MSGTHGPQHHACAMQRVAGAPEIVPADAIDLVQVLMDWIVDAVEVGEATGVKPPP